MEKALRKPRYFWQITYAHTIAYFIVWRCTSWLESSGYRYPLGAAPEWLIAVDGEAQALGAALQVFSGLLLALVLLPLRRAFFEEKRGLLKLGVLLVWLSCSLLFVMGTGSFLGYVHPPAPFACWVYVHSRMIAYAALFIGILALAKMYGHKKVVTVLSIAMVSFICLWCTKDFLISASGILRGTLTDERDGQTYKTVRIGRDTWMAENLNFKVDSSWCYRDADSACAKYGRLYTFRAAMAACPIGWHLASNWDWHGLVSLSGGMEVAGKMLKSKSGWADCCGETDGNGIDKFGFSALPGSCRNRYGNFCGSICAFGFWWSSEEYRDGCEYEGGCAYYWHMSSGDDSVLKQHSDNRLGSSVRCVKDRVGKKP